MVTNVVGFSKSISDVFDRPANTDAYGAHDVVGPATARILEFPLAGRIAKGTGYVVKGLLFVESTNITAAFRLHLYSRAPTVIADNAAFTLLEADMDDYLGYIDFTDPVTGGSGTAMSVYQNLDVRMHFNCNADSSAETDETAKSLVDRKLFGVLEAVEAFTPTSAQAFRVTIAVDQD